MGTIIIGNLENVQVEDARIVGKMKNIIMKDGLHGEQMISLSFE